MLTNVLLTVGLLWLLVLTILFAGVVRHLGAMQAAGTGDQAPRGGWLFDTDGPWIPSELPDRARAALQTNGIQTDDLTATFFSSRCGPCVERATEVAAVVADPTRNVFLVTGAQPEAVQNMREILQATGARILTDPDAHDVVKSLDISSTPFAFRIVDGQVVGKAYLRNVDDYSDLAGMSVEAAIAQATRAADDASPAAQRPTAEVLDGFQQ